MSISHDHLEWYNFNRVYNVSFVKEEIMHGTTCTFINLAPLLNPGYAPVMSSKLLLTYLPFPRSWRSTLIDLGPLEKHSAVIRTTPTPPPPPSMHILELI